MKSILTFDPGESTGWCYQDENGAVTGGTAKRNHAEVAQLIEKYKPDIVIFERFNLYPQMAKSLAWNSFYPCEVIGVIRYLCDHYDIPYVEQAPSVKKYFGGFKVDWEKLKLTCQHEVTEHTKDAYQHYRYFLLNKAKFYGVSDPLKAGDASV